MDSLSLTVFWTTFHGTSLRNTSIPSFFEFIDWRCFWLHIHLALARQDYRWAPISIAIIQRWFRLLLCTVLFDDHTDTVFFRQRLFTVVLGSTVQVCFLTTIFIRLFFDSKFSTVFGRHFGKPLMRIFIRYFFDRKLLFVFWAVISYGCFSKNISILFFLTAQFLALCRTTIWRYFFEEPFATVHFRGQVLTVS